jgi:hemerythrin
MAKQKLMWKDEYSVGVEQIDNQHKQIFETINLLIDIMAGMSDGGGGRDQLDVVIQRLVTYKKIHFATEEKFFDEFDYEYKEDHKAKHREFNEKMGKLVSLHTGDSIGLAFGLVDFLEDWLLSHLLVEDHKYINCFREHGLK